jgi:hypothetical protein
MKNGAAALALILSGCGTVPPAPWAKGPEVSESACTASCNAHYEQCPQVFARFPERGAVECPAEHSNCLKVCENAKAAPRAAAPPAAAPPAVPPPDPAPVAAASPAPAPTAPAPPAPVAASPGRAVASKEARLRELKHFYDEGLVSEDVYRERQRAILSEP